MQTERCYETTKLTLALDPDVAGYGEASHGELEVRVYWDATPTEGGYEIENIEIEIAADTGLRWRKSADYIRKALVNERLREWCRTKMLTDDAQRGVPVSDGVGE